MWPKHIIRGGNIRRNTTLSPIRNREGNKELFVSQSDELSAQDGQYSESDELSAQDGQ
ncbi:MAG: hypothetical protein HQL32_11715 [Planctomycetes bacterium]|nr:hypothetical protein [Planctomycetota bacterium]